MTCLPTSNTLGAYDEHRKAARMLFVEKLKCNTDDFDWQFKGKPTERTGMDIIADALAFATAAVTLASKMRRELKPHLLVSDYVEYASFRERADKLFERYLTALPEDFQTRAERLMQFCGTFDRSGSKWTTIWSRRKRGKDNDIREAARILGGVSTAAAVIGVTTMTLWGWISRGKVANAEKGALLFRLAGLSEDDSTC